MGNVLRAKTPVQVAIEKATSEMLPSPDWETNLMICDAVNQKESLAEPAVAHMVTRLRSNIPTVLRHSLTLAETCVKNCGPPLHRAIATKAFMGALVNIGTAGPDTLTRHQALALIESWGVGFESRQSEPYLAVFVQTYQALRRRSDVEFPPQDVDTAFVPIFTPPERENHQPEPPPQLAAAQPQAARRVYTAAEQGHVHRTIKEIRTERGMANHSSSVPTGPLMEGDAADQAAIYDVNVAKELVVVLRSVMEEGVSLDDVGCHIRDECVEAVQRVCKWLSGEQLREEQTITALLDVVDELNSVLDAFDERMQLETIAGEIQPEDEASLCTDAQESSCDDSVLEGRALEQDGAEIEAAAQLHCDEEHEARQRAEAVRMTEAILEAACDDDKYDDDFESSLDSMHIGKIK